MFICPKFDVRDMQNPSNIMPSAFSLSSVNGAKADIFVSRIPRIFQMFERFSKSDARFELVLLIGDSDFAPEIGYNWMAVESALRNGANMGDFNLEIYASRVTSYKEYLVQLLNKNRVQNGIELFQAVPKETILPTTASRVIRVFSLYEKYLEKEILNATNYNFDPAAIREEAELKFKYFQDQIEKYDPEFFKKLTIADVQRVTEAKFRSYRDQGQLIQQMGGILIADELPPVIKASMYANELIIMWPWIRREDPLRNPEYIADKPRKPILIEP